MKCFVISPIGSENSEIRKHADEVFRYVIEPALEQFDIEPIRSDHMNEPGKISDQMYRAIFEYDLCIAVLTYANPNVYYELAVAQSASRPVIILIEKGNSLPFDVQDFRSLSYDLTITSYQTKAHINRLAMFLGEIKQNGWKGDDVFRNYRKQSPSASALDVKPFAIRITNPIAKSTVDIVNVEGTFEKLPDDYELRSLRYYPDQDAFVPHGTVAIDRAKKMWKVNRFDVGGRSGDRRGIEISLVGRNAKIFLDYCNEADRVHRIAMDTIHKLTGEYGQSLPTIRNWPADLVTCDRIEVTRK